MRTNARPAWKAFRWGHRAGSVLVCAGALAAAGALTGPLAQAGAASGDVNEASCPNEAQSGFTRALPDCRAYEQVTPPYKQGYPVNTSAVIADGSTLMGWSWGVFAGAEGVPQQRGSSGTEYQFSRGPGGWVTSSLAPPSSEFYGSSTWYTTGSSLTNTLWSMPTPPVGQDDFYVRGSDGSFVDIGPATPPADGPTDPPAPEGSGPRLPSNFPFQGASADLSHFLYQIDSTERGFIWPGDTTLEASSDLYEYAGVGNAAPSMVGVRGGPGATDLIGQCGVEAGGPDSANNAISSDGAAVFFTPVGADERECGGEQPPVDELFARLSGARTVPLSAPSPQRCTTPACLGAPLSDALYEGAATDGSKAFFTSTQQLTDEASEDSESGDSAVSAVGSGCPEAHAAGCNLYEYDFANPAGDNLVLVSGGSSEPHVQGVARISPDGSHVYFVAKGVLTSTPNSEGATAQAGEDNLYLFERDALFPGGKVSFIGTLLPSDENLWGGNQNLDIGRPAQTTPDGRFLVFQSHADLTADDTSSGVWQVFEYDALSGALKRVSIGEGGFNEDGNTTVDSATIPAPAYARSGGAGQRPQPLAVSDDGARVFFQSADGLTPAALNSVVIDAEGHKANNVYEYEDGHVFLISDGQDVTVAGNGTGSNVSLISTTASGNDVFFTSGDQLLPQDVDTQQDIYDARVGGGFAVSPQAAECRGETCLGPLASSPSTPGAGSATQPGGENLPPPPASASRKPTASQLATERLRAALRSCRRKHSRKLRTACERKAHARFSPHASHKAKRSRRHR